jgi:hypothetical protein
MDQGLVLEKIVSSKQLGIAPVEVYVSFKVNEKPKRVILRKSLIDMPSADGPVTIPAAAGKVTSTLTLKQHIILMLCDWQDCRA